MKGKYPAFLVFAILLIGAYGWQAHAGTPADHGSGVGYPLARGLAKVVQGSDLGSFGPPERLVALLALAAAAALAFQLFLYWTGNRVVAFLAAGLFALHPAARDPLLGGDALVHALSALLGLLTLCLREAGWHAWREGRSPVRSEIHAAIVYALACLSGPSALGLPLIVALVEFVFHHHEPAGRRRETVAIPVAYIVIAFALWHFDEPSPEKWRFAGTAMAFAERCASFCLLPLSGVPAIVVTALLVAGGLAVFGLGVRSLGRGPKWIAIYAGFGVVWWILAELPGIVGIVPAEGSRPILGFAGPGLVLPALVWRAVLRAFPEVALSRTEPPPVFIAQSAMPKPAARPVAAAAPRFHLEQSSVPSGSGVLLSAAQIRESVEVAVTAAVGAAVAAARRGLGPLGSRAGPAAAASYSAEWDAAERAWSDSSAGASKKLLGAEWSHRALDQNLFDNYCRPYLGDTSCVIELGPGSGKFTAMIASLVARVVAVDTSIEVLRRTKDDLRDHANIDFVHLDGTGLDGIAAGSCDFAFSHDLFVHLDQEDIYLYLRDLWRVLLPGGRAVVSFANLLDPLGFAQFEEAARTHKAGNRSAARINFLVPEVIRKLAAAASFEVESLHLAANNRDMIAILSRNDAFLEGKN